MTRCIGCGEVLTGKCMKVGSRLWHPDCFICHICGKAITEGSFSLHLLNPCHTLCYNERFAPRCASCGEPVNGEHIRALGKEWHPEHFTCAHCGLPMKDGRFFEHDGLPFCNEDYTKLFAPRCAGCDEPITGSYTSALEQKWHPDHFICTHCSEPLRSKSFSVKEGRPYCKKDYHRLFSPSCSLCHQPMEDSYLTDRWGNSFCRKREGELPRCFSCGRLVSKEITGGGVRYRDGRNMCTICRRTAVEHPDTAGKVLAWVREQLSAHDIALPGNIPLRLVGQEELDRLSAGGRNEQTTGMARTRLTMENGKETGRSLDDIVVLYGLPGMHLAAVLAHELAHAYLFLNGYRGLSLKVEEGIAELFSYLCLKDRKDPEAVFRIRTMEKNSHPVYGTGFRAARRAMERYSLPRLLELVRKNSRLPV